MSSMLRLSKIAASPGISKVKKVHFHPKFNFEMRIVFLEKMAVLF
jgi:hypothetical protein